MSYLTIKSLHLIFMVTWFSGIFYLPRLFVYHRQTIDNGLVIDEMGYQRFLIMERKLFVMMTIGAFFTVFFGLWLVFAYNIMAMWLSVKLMFVLMLMIFHGWCWLTIKHFKSLTHLRSETFYRLVNEVPVFILFAVIFLAIYKPL